MKIEYFAVRIWMLKLCISWLWNYKKRMFTNESISINNNRWMSQHNTFMNKILLNMNLRFSSYKCNNDFSYSYSQRNNTWIYRDRAVELKHMHIFWKRMKVINRTKCEKKSKKKNSCIHWIHTLHCVFDVVWNKRWNSIEMGII